MVKVKVDKSFSNRILFLNCITFLLGFYQQSVFSKCNDIFAIFISETIKLVIIYLIPIVINIGVTWKNMDKKILLQELKMFFTLFGTTYIFGRIFYLSFATILWTNSQYKQLAVFYIPIVIYHFSEYAFVCKYRT